VSLCHSASGSFSNSVCAQNSLLGLKSKYICALVLICSCVKASKVILLASLMKRISRLDPLSLDASEALKNSMYDSFSKVYIALVIFQRLPSHCPTSSIMFLKSRITPFFRCGTLSLTTLTLSRGLAAQ